MVVGVRRVCTQMLSVVTVLAKPRPRGWPPTGTRAVSHLTCFACTPNRRRMSRTGEIIGRQRSGSQSVYAIISSRQAFYASTTFHFGAVSSMEIPGTATPWYSRTIETVARALETQLDHGLGVEEAQARLSKVGPNELRERPPEPFWKKVVDQLNSFVVILLIVASVVSALLGDWIEAVVIMAIVVLNAVLGVLQESRDEQALAALKKMAAPDASVIRDGHRQRTPARELVPGDGVLLDAGNFVPADLRLI